MAKRSSTVKILVPSDERNENKSNFILHFARFFVPSQPDKAIWRLMSPDVRESGESPELYLQL